MNVLKEGVINGDGGDNAKFSVISCGYLIAGILKQPGTQANAASHWQECLSLDTAGKSEISATADAPTVSAVAPVSGSANTFSVSGSGFTSTNFVKLVPAGAAIAAPEESPVSRIGMTAAALWAFNNVLEAIKNIIPFVHAQTAGSYYEIDSVQSANGSTMSFSVPSNIPDGKYTVSISGANSPWTDTTQVITVSGNGAGDPTSAVAAQPAVSGNGTVPAIPNYSCPAGTVITGDNAACFAPVTNTSVAAHAVPATATYYCLGSQSLGNYPYDGYPKSCSGGNTAGFKDPGVNYSCPAGAGNAVFTSSWICNIPAASLFTPAVVMTPIISYSCPSNYSLSGSTCTPNMACAHYHYCFVDFSDTGIRESNNNDCNRKILMSVGVFAGRE